MAAPLEQSVLDNTLLEFEKHGRDAAATAKAMQISVPAVYGRLRIAGVKLPRKKSVRVPKPIAEQPRTDEQQLWDRYIADRSEANRNLLVEKYWEEITIWVRKFCNKKQILADDYYAAAAFALLDVVERFDPSRGLKFQTFAQARINGALLDRCREDDHSKRGPRLMQKARIAVEKDGLRESEEVQKLLGWTKEQYRMSFVPFLNSIQDKVFTATETKKDCAKSTHIEDLLGRSDIRAIDREETFLEMCKGLDLRETVIMYLLYQCEHNIVTVSNILHLSESRVSQIHIEILKRLRQRGWDHTVELAVG